GERAGDADALALAARHLVRIAVGELRIEAAYRQEIAHLVTAAAAIGLDAVHLDGLGDDLAHLPARVQRAVGVLEDHLHAPAQRDQVAPLHAVDVLAVEQDLAGGRLLQPQDAAAGRGLAAAALAHQAQRLAAADREVDAVDRLHVADLARQHD